jgi:hypothetical protein
MKYNSIFIIINRLTKYMYIISYIENNMVKDLVYIFFRIIIINYSILEKIILNRNKLFISKF